MALVLLPGHEFPLDRTDLDALMQNMVQLNILDAGFTERQQRAIGLLLKIVELKAKSGLDYTGREGHKRLTDASMAFAGSHFNTMRHGDLLAAHLGLSYSNTQRELQKAGMKTLTDKAHGLLAECVDLAQVPERTEERLDFTLSYLKRTL